MEGIIYKYTSPSGKSYVGQTRNEIKRKNRFRDLTKVYGSGGKIDNARKKYGPENFTYEILETINCDDQNELTDLLNEKEIYYIAKYNTFKNGYNSTPGGQFNWSEIYSQSHKGKKHSEETKRKISESIRKCKNDPNWSQKPMSEEAKQRMSERFSKAILQYDLKGNFVKEWKSAAEASKELNIDSSYIRKCIKNNKIGCNFIWKEYSDNYPLQIDITSKVKNIGALKGTKVLQCDLEGNLINTFDSPIDVQNKLGYPRGNVSKACRGVLKTYKGYIWKYDI